MSADSLNTVTAEIRDRVTRIESRIVKLGEHMGADLRTNARVLVQPRAGLCPTVTIDSLDVSLSRITQELTRLGYGTRGIPIIHNGRHVATME